MFTVTTDAVTGRVVVATLALVHGIAVRTRGLGGNIMAGLHAVGDNDALAEYCEALSAVRQEAITQMTTRARELGANAVIGVRFDAADAGHSMTEVVAYGTAVIVAVTES